MTTPSYIALSNILFDLVSASASKVIESVIDRRGTAAELVREMPTLRIENIALFFNACLDVFNEGNMAPLLTVSPRATTALKEDVEGCLRACCEALAARGAPIPSKIPLSRRGTAAFQAETGCR